MILWVAKCVDGPRYAMGRDHAAVSYENIRKHLSGLPGSTWSVFQIACPAINENIVRVWNRDMPNEWAKQAFRVRVSDSGRLMKLDDSGKEVTESSQTSEPQGAANKDGSES